MTAKAITKLLELTGWSCAELVEAMRGPTFGLAPAPTEELVRKWEGLEALSVPVALCIRRIAAAERLMWDGRRWVSANTERMTGAEVRALRERLKWTQARLAREVGLHQPQVAHWEQAPDKPLTPLATFALRAVERQYSEGTPRVRSTTRKVLA